MTIKFTTQTSRRGYKSHMMSVNGKRCGVYIITGPWVDGVPPELIKVQPRKSRFPAEFRAAFAIENNSDIMTDYFEADTIRLMPGHPAYDLAKEAATGESI